ncbi:MAG: hypothetical protein ACKVJG_14335 [Candidatus Latescibacterota bacterium]
MAATICSSVVCSPGTLREKALRGGNTASIVAAPSSRRGLMATQSPTAGSWLLAVASWRKRPATSARNSPSCQSKR